ncbi:FkbM family methyltransferase [Cyclobacterium sp. SYSU L10401]|uniref:FkbM family methyltransferase n=1 Tax=Cyclobacterium sp. SYSU L10401 TaxID=2678657 RepID=UPI0013D4F840|nr:FkbM family methyltransferase [Cyclobacterium sp. SYSU L10401]
MHKLHLIHKVKSFFIDKRPKGFGRVLKLIDALFFKALPEGELLIKTLDGFQLFINPKYDKGIERKLYLTGVYEKGLLRVLDNILSPGDVMVDAGANIGLISIFSAFKVGDEGLVVAFEPHPETFSILQKNILINGLTKILLFNKALGSASGIAKIYSNLQINRGAASLVLFEKNSPSFDVDVVTLDSILTERNIHKVNLLKIDVEGFEMEVLKGSHSILSKSNGPILVVECSTTRSNFNYSMDDLFDFLTHQYSYHVFKFSISKEKTSKLIPVERVKDLPEHDNILAFKDLHLLTFSKNTSIFEG